jgi:hypothetical protein
MSLVGQSLRTYPATALTFVRYAPNSASGRMAGGQFWSPIPPLRGVKFARRNTRLCFGCNLAAAALYLFYYPERSASMAIILLLPFVPPPDRRPKAFR